MLDSSKKRTNYSVGSIWGIVGVVALLLSAVWRLTPTALEPILDRSLTWWQMLLYGVWVVANVYAEGYRAFQQSFCPRVVARAQHLGIQAKLYHTIWAPLFCMGLFHATRRRLMTSWSMVLGILTLVVLVRRLPQPWRGIIDGGVVVGLSWGIVAILILFGQGLTGRPVRASAELPQS